MCTKTPVALQFPKLSGDAHSVAPCFGRLHSTCKGSNPRARPSSSLTWPDPPNVIVGPTHQLYLQCKAGIDRDSFPRLLFFFLGGGGGGQGGRGGRFWLWLRASFSQSLPCSELRKRIYAYVKGVCVCVRERGGVMGGGGGGRVVGSAIYLTSRSC